MEGKSRPIWKHAMLQQKTNCQGAVRLLPRPIQPREGIEARAFCARFRAITRPCLEKKLHDPDGEKKSKLHQRSRGDEVKGLFLGDGSDNGQKSGCFCVRN